MSELKIAVLDDIQPIIDNETIPGHIYWSKSLDAYVLRTVGYLIRLDNWHSYIESALSKGTSFGLYPVKSASLKIER